MRTSGPALSDPVATARVLDRVATLIAAGSSPARAWTLVGGPSARSDTAAWEDVSAVMDVAGQSGAPVAPTLQTLAAALRRTAAGERAVRVALAGPRTSANVVLALPLLGVVLAPLWGVDTLGVLVGSPFGWVCLAVACCLVVIGRAWSRRLVAALEPDGHVVGALLDAWAVALAGGGSWNGAGDLVHAAMAHRAPGPDERARLAETLALADRAGVPAAALLRNAAEDLRDDVAAASLAAAERLGVRLVLPLGLCVLPAFVVVGVVPVVVGLLSSTVPDLG